MNMMTLECRILTGLLFALSLLVVAAAWGFELIGGYRPCPLCLQQRWAYYFVIAAAPIAYFLMQTDRRRAASLVLALSAGAYVLNAGLGTYHAGIEWHWWSGPLACSGSGAPILLADENLLDTLNQVRVIRCDQAPWHLFGVSLAGFNALASAALAALSFLAFRQINRSNKPLP